MGKVQFGQEAATPATPAATKLTLYQGSDGKLYTIDSAGTIVNLTNKVDRAGDTMTGYLSVPSGASGTQVMQAQEVTALVANSGGGQIAMYFDETVVIPAGTGPQTIPVETLSRTLSTGPEVDESVTVSTGTTPIALIGAAYIDGPMGSTVIPSGPFEFDYWFYCDSATGVNQIIPCIYRDIQQTGATITITGTGTSRTATVTGGTPFVAGDANADMTLSGWILTPNAQLRITGYTSTSVVTVECLSTYTNEAAVAFTLNRYLFQSTTGDINVTTATQKVFPYYITTPITVNATDRIVCRNFGKTDSASARVIHLLFGGTSHYSHFHTTLSQDISQNMYAAPAVTTFQDADRLGFWNSLTSTIAHITPANIWTWIQTKAAAGITSIFKFMTYIDFPYAGQIYQYTTGGALVRGYVDIGVNMTGGLAVSATYAAGVMTYTVAGGHGLSSGTTTDRVTVRGFTQPEYNVTNSVYTYISATQFSVTTAGAPASPGTGATPLSYALNLYEKFETVNASVDVTTGIWANRDTAALCKFTGYSEGGIDRWFQDNTTTAGTVPSWVKKAEFDLVNNVFSIGQASPPSTSAWTLQVPSLYVNGSAQSVGVFTHRTHQQTLNKAGSGFLQWVTRTTTGAEAALQLAYIELINFVSITLGAIAAGKLEWDGTDLWFSESATVRSPINNSKYLINAQVGTTYTFVLADKGYLVTFSNAAAITATVPPNSSVAFPIGTIIRVAQDGAGKLTIAAGVGVTINSLAGNKAMAGQYSDAWLIKEATDTWYLFGNLIA